MISPTTKSLLFCMHNLYWNVWNAYTENTVVRKFEWFIFFFLLFTWHMSIQPIYSKSFRCVQGEMTWKPPPGKFIERERDREREREKLWMVCKCVLVCVSYRFSWHMYTYVPTQAGILRGHMQTKKSPKHRRDNNSALLLLLVKGRKEGNCSGAVQMYIKTTAAMPCPQICVDLFFLSKIIIVSLL